MKGNISCTERVLSIVVGAVLVTFAYTHQLNSWAWIGAVPLATGIIEFCPLYTIICVHLKDGRGYTCRQSLLSQK